MVPQFLYFLTDSGVLGLVPKGFADPFQPSRYTNMNRSRSGIKVSTLFRVDKLIRLFQALFASARPSDWETIEEVRMRTKSHEKRS